MSYSLTVNYDTAASLSFSSTNVEVASSTLRLKDLGGGTYTTTAQLVTCQEQVAIGALSSFSESSTVPGNTAITYQLVLGGVAYYYNATNSVWALAVGSAQSSSASVINTNASTLFTSLNILTPQFLALNIYLSSTSGAARPVLTSNTIGYSWTNSSQTVMGQCVVSGYLSNLIAGLPAYNAAQPVQLTVSCDRAFFHGNNFIEPFTKNFSFDSSGHVSASIIETATPGVKLNFYITFYDGTSIYSSKLFNAIVPNQAAIDIDNLSTLYPYNFG